ncbi:MAG: zinc-ribbon domain-containing protein [Alphaproteobacteria bacterium]|nr:zinc-ribbon domain-containing protein [Alphaproteobacteria bacterium]
MLISCPKCQSLYEIPDDLIGKTGKNFRCQTCLNVWHAMPEDALDYDEKKQDEPFIEAIDVSSSPHRLYPANKEEYTIPADYKSGSKTRSSKELIAKEGDPDFIPPTPKKKKEITLTSSAGTAFTINAAPLEDISVKPRFFTANEELTVSAADRLLPEKPQKHYKKTKLFLLCAALLLTVLFLRREVVALYPDAEIWYNKIYLSGINNPENLKFENITVEKTTQNNTPTLNLKADIVNDSPYATIVPNVTIGTENKSYKPAVNFLKSGEKTSVTLPLPAPQPNQALGLTLRFEKN